MERTRSIERECQRRLRALRRSIGTDIERLRTDASATKGRLAGVAGLDRTFLGRIETGAVNPSLETLAAISLALGADLSIRFYPGTGPRLTDRHQARMIEAVLRGMAPGWTPHLEVPVVRPARGVIDVVLERAAEGLFVVGEAHSAIARLEQQVRWAGEKAASLHSSDLVREGADPKVSRLLILRSTAATRSLARQFEATLRAVYPAATVDAVRALREGAAWPGNALIWVRIEGERVELLDGPPRGVGVGR